MKPLVENVEYGAVVPVEFTVVNGESVPVFLDRIEATAGRRWELMSCSRREVVPLTKEGDLLREWPEDKYPPNAMTGRVLLHSGLLMPGQELRFRLPYRIIAAEDKLLLTITPTSIADLEGSVYLPRGDGEWKLADGPGLTAFGKQERPTLDPAAPSRDAALLRLKPVPLPEPIVAGAIVGIPAPVAPFDPKWSRNPSDRPEAWAYSPKLDGYLVRVRAGSYNLQREDEVIPLPPVPFELFEAVDGEEGRTTLLRVSGDVTEVTAENVLDVLEEVLRARRQVAFSDAPDRAAFQEKAW